MKISFQGMVLQRDGCGDEAPAETLLECCRRFKLFERGEDEWCLSSLSLYKILRCDALRLCSFSTGQV